MAEFHVIHLSDLHIGKKITSTHRKLIRDIKAQTEHFEDNSIFLLVTGDVIDKGNYAECEQNVISFFEQLKAGLGNKVCDIQIVAGNHDKDNSIDPYAKITSTSIQMEQHSSEEIEELLKLQEKYFEKFLEISNKIFELFGIDKKVESTFGVEFRKHNDSNLSFIRINTSLATCGKKNEEFHLATGSGYIDKIIDTYQTFKAEIESKGEKLLTFCLAHHPTSFLTPEESQKVNESLIDEERLNVDFFLSGHTHERSVSNLSNHTRRMTSLVTGIGWNHDAGVSTRAIEKTRHRYSIYTFDENKNIYTVTMRKTTESGDFAPDSDYFITEEERRTGKLYFPLEERSQAFVSVNEYSPTEKRNIAVDNETVINLKVLSECLRKYVLRCEKLIENYKHLYFRDVLFGDEESRKDFVKMFYSFMENAERVTLEEMVEKISSDEKVYSRCQEMLHNRFTSFLLDLVLLLPLELSDYFGEEVETRAAFRRYFDEEKYKPICYYPKDVTPRDTGENGNSSGKPRDYDWESSLVQHSYRNNCRPMIYSVNKKYNNFESDNWEDFIVFVPKLPNSTVFSNKAHIGSVHEERPLLSFTFSVRLKHRDEYEKSSIDYKNKMKRISNKLFLLEFFSIDKIITNLLLNFIKYLPLNAQTYFKNQN